MNPEIRRQNLAGIAVSLPTFNDDEYNLQLDRSEGPHQLAHRPGHRRAGNAIIFIAGGLGEGYFLDDDEWEAMANTLVEAVDGRAPTGIGVFELSARRAARKARYAADLGMDYIQCAPPRYLQPTEDEIFAHYNYIGDRADIGIMAYNTPWAMPSGYSFSQSLIERLAEIENFAGIKWSSPNAQQYMSMIRLFGERVSFISNGSVMSIGYKLGARGFTDFMVNVAPRLSLHRWQLVQEQRWDEFDRIELAMQIDPPLNAVRPGELSGPGNGRRPRRASAPPRPRPRHRPTLPRPSGLFSRPYRGIPTYGRRKRNPRMGRLGRFGLRVSPRRGIP